MEKRSKRTRAELAKVAIQIQDACNPSAVVIFLREVYDLLFDEQADTNAKCTDPIVYMVVSKLADLCHMCFIGNTEAYGKAYDECKELAGQ